LHDLNVASLPYPLRLLQLLGITTTAATARDDFGHLSKMVSSLTSYSGELATDPAYPDSPAANWLMQIGIRFPLASHIEHVTKVTLATLKPRTSNKMRRWHQFKATLMDSFGL
jgi:hypothetical protein